MTDPDETNDREAETITQSPAPAPAVGQRDGEVVSTADQAVANQERMLETGEENPV